MSLIRNARRRAKQRRLPFSLTKADVHVPDFCPVLGIRLVHGEGQSRSESPTLDRIDPNRGYVPGNVIVVSMKANRIKSDGTPLEILRVAHFYLELTKGKLT